MGDLWTPERQQRIVQLLAEKKRATVAELSELYGVSEATIRRDLDKLDSAGLLRRTHGGVIFVEPAVSEPPVIQRMAENSDEKRRIGRATAQLIQSGETIFLGSGTTTLEVARHLHEKKNLTVITNALNVANELANAEGIDLVITGGFLRRSELSMIGHITEQALNELHAAKVVMGIRAISVEGGLTNDYLPEVMTDRAIIQMASEVILVADHNKFGKVSTVLVAPITSVNKAVTDAGVPPKIVAELRAKGIEVIIVSDEEPEDP